jgi:hypothetical protein
MLNKISGKISAITLSALATVTPSFVSAESIALTFEKHGVTIAGDYAGFRENAYVIITTAGILHVPAVLVTCEGVNCLDIMSTTAQES